jgi:2-C-methyl-D-erythritol 2,4-cyclodiphosphate synthase
MRDNVAHALDLHIDQVSIKATTNEELGYIGIGDGAAAYAVVSIRGTQMDLNL